MDNYKYTTEDEIYLHKKKLMENEQLKASSKVILYISLIFLFLLLVISLYTMRDSFICDSPSAISSICKHLHKNLNCRTTLASPLQVEALLKINNTFKLTSISFCGFDKAISEIRICFIISAITSIYFAFKAITKSNKKLSYLFSYCALFISFLMIISSLFDYISIQDAKNNNFNICHTSDVDITEHKDYTISSEKVHCSFGIFYICSLIEMISGVTLLLGSYSVDMWSKTIQSDDY